MIILAHRGIWNNENEKNTIEAIKRAFTEGFGIETDIRDYCGEIVISHNPPMGSEPKLDDVFSIYEECRKNGREPDMALNIKADGLYLLLESVLRAHEHANNYFFFDMSVPEQYVYLKKKYPIYTRSSEYEKSPLFIDNVDGIWLDQFTECDHIETVLPQYIKLGKRVAIISPEIHGRNHMKLWNFLKRYKENELVSLCTDKPEEARDYFG